MFHWNIDPVILKFGSLQIHWYGVIFAFALFLSYKIEEYIFKKEHKDTNILDTLFIYVIIGLIVGARLVHVLFYDPSYYLQHPLEVIQVWKGGLASHGGFLGVITALLLFCKKHNINFLWLLARVSMPAILVGAFIRLGNFFNSELVGKATNENWGVIFDRIDNIIRHPVVIYESISYFIIFFILFLIYKKISAKSYTNIAVGLIFTLGFSARFVLEFFKTSQSQFAKEIPLTMGQVLSIPYIIVGLILLMLAIKKR